MCLESPDRQKNCFIKYELEAFDYEAYKKNGFKMEHLNDYPLKLETKDWKESGEPYICTLLGEW